MSKTTQSKSEIRLSPVSYVVLGLIGLRGPSTVYELKVAAGRSTSYFWPFAHSQLYGEPQRLADAGMLSETQETEGRRRRIYAMTNLGTETLAAWLRSPPGEVFEMRDLAVLQLFFSEYMSDDDLAALARSQVALFEERLAVYRAILDLNAGRPARRMAPLDLGRRMAQACLEFWAEIAEVPPPVLSSSDQAAGL